MSKILKKTLCGVLAASAAVASVGMFSACETSKPGVEIQIQFNGVTYALDYTLHRKLAPATVAHFLNLAENNFYDGLCVHDYDDSRLYTGGYSYVEGGENGGLQYADYFAKVKAESFKNFSPTVWENSEKQTPTYTVYGEFSKNNFKVTSGALKETFGSLTMYYTPKDGERDVWVQRADGDGADWRTYKYNSATSLFYISLSSTEKNNTEYCTFATLDEDCTDDLTDLQNAISDYISSNYENESESDFTTEVKIPVDEDDPIEGDADREATYKVPNQPILIKKVTVKKY